MTPATPVSSAGTTHRSLHTAADPLATKDRYRAQDEHSRGPDVDAVIIGAGFGGMGAAIALRRCGIDSIVILEQADDVGGTWHRNSYPGIAVDIASLTYSFSFEPNPDWSRLYAPGAELARYAGHVADKYDLRRLVRFDSQVTATVFDEDRQLWHIDIAGQPSLTTRLLIVATGYLSHPKRPGIPGLDTFTGTVIHTAEWDHTHDLTGQRVAVIGTGATSVQLIPEIAGIVAQLDVYQRTPIWVAPKLDMAVPAPVRTLFRRVPLTQQVARHVSSASLEALMVTGVLHDRQLPATKHVAERLCRAHLRRQVHDPELRAKLTPAYNFGCKRPTFSNTYFSTFTRPNVALHTAGIQRITTDGILDADGTHRPIDTLVLATGYKVWEQGNLPAFPIVGRGGQELGARWNSERFATYEGITVPGYPNLFHLPSPYSFTGLSYFFAIESQMAHIDRVLNTMRRRHSATFEVTHAAQERFMAQMDRASRNTVFANGQCGGSNSYYFDPHGEAGLVRLSSTWSALRRASRFPVDDYYFQRTRSSTHPPRVFHNDAEAVNTSAPAGTRP